MSQKKALCVEDNTDSLTFLQKLLSTRNYAVVTARLGEEALRLAREEKPDIVLLDINLPDIDGYTVARRLRELPEFAQVPIIAITADATLGTREKCIAAGCNDYMAKPADPAQLLQLVEKHLAPKKAE